MNVPHTLQHLLLRRLRRDGVAMLPRYTAHLFQPFLESLLTQKGWIYRSEDPLLPDLASLNTSNHAPPSGILADTRTPGHDLFHLITEKVMPVLLILDRYPQEWMQPRSPLAALSPWIYWQDRRVIRLQPVSDPEEKARWLARIQDDPSRLALELFPYRTLTWPISPDRAEDLFRLFLVVQQAMEEEEALRFAAQYRRDPRSFASAFHLWMQRATRDPERARTLQEAPGLPVKVDRGRFRFLVPDIRRILRHLHLLDPDREAVLFPHPRAVPFLLQRWAIHRPLDTLLLPGSPDPSEELPSLSPQVHVLRSRWTRTPRLQENGLWWYMSEGPHLHTQPTPEGPSLLLLRHPGPDDPLLVAEVPAVESPPADPPTPAYVLEGYLEGEAFRLFLDEPLAPDALPDRARLARERQVAFAAPPPLTVGDLLRGIHDPSDLSRLHRWLGVLFRKRLLFHPYLPEGALRDTAHLRRLAERLLQRRFPDLQPVERTPPAYALLPASPLYAEDLYDLLGGHPDARALIGLYRTVVRRFLAWMLPEARVDLERLTVRAGTRTLTRTRLTKIHTQGHLWVLPLPLRDPLRPPIPLHGVRVRGIRQEDFGALLAQAFEAHPAPLPLWAAPARTLFRRLG